VQERDGVLWVAPVDPSAAPAPAPADRDEFGNLDASLEHAWHPVALDRELADRVDVRLLGRTWTLVRTAAGVRARAGSSAATRRRVGAQLPADEPFGILQRYGVIWLAPAEPRTALIDAPDDADPAFAGDWLVPDRTASAAGLMADNFLDVAHFPFVHAGTFGAAEEPLVPAYDVEPQPDGFRSVQEQWFDNPEDPAVVAGQRDVRQRRRVTYTYRAPFQLTLRMQELDAGAVKTILFFLQPEDARSTRIYTKLLLHGIGGVPVPLPDVVRREIDFEVAVLAEDLALQRAVASTGLPLTMRDELHVRADRCGVALRRALASFRAGAHDRP
jgi:phenylpropionate dioxygenase-like ring-hydroxylating dioxygenase large terminal subunit